MLSRSASTTGLGRNIENVRNKAAALYVAEKIVSESGTVARSFNESRNIGNDKTLVVYRNDAEIR